MGSEYHSSVLEQILGCEGTINCFTDVTKVLSPHVEEAHVTIVDRLVVRRAGVSVVQGGSVQPRTADAGVRNVPASANKVAVVVKDGFLQNAVTSSGERTSA